VLTVDHLTEFVASHFRDVVVGVGVGVGVGVSVGVGAGVGAGVGVSVGVGVEIRVVDNTAKVYVESSLPIDEARFVNSVQDAAVKEYATRVISLLHAPKHSGAELSSW
jgi:tetrahydrodipicolinate N-succinyltransferase